eukprot:914118-Pyramimonas_sp.AAC.1
MGMESFQFIEKALDTLPKFHQFDMPQLSQETPVRPVLQPHFIAPGPAAEGPAKPAISGNNVPFNAELTGVVDDMTLVNYHPFTQVGPARPPAAQPPGGGKDNAPAATPPGGAGQSNDGGDHNTAPST